MLLPGAVGKAVASVKLKRVVKVVLSHNASSACLILSRPNGAVIADNMILGAKQLQVPAHAGSR